MDKIHVLGKGYESVLLKYIDAESLPTFLGGQCFCSHMPGGCVPLIAQKSKDRFVATEQNEKVDTAYNPSIMQAALTDELLCGLLPTSSNQPTATVP